MPQSAASTTRPKSRSLRDRCKTSGAEQLRRHADRFRKDAGKSVASAPPLPLRFFYPLPNPKNRASSFPRAGDDMTSLTDRRNETRVNVRIPLRFKLIGNQTAVEHLAESENVSQRGVFMWTAYPLKIGAQVELRLKMPNEISGVP